MCLYICPGVGKTYLNWYGAFSCGDCPHAIPHQHVEKCDINCWDELDGCVPVLDPTS